MFKIMKRILTVLATIALVWNICYIAPLAADVLSNSSAEYKNSDTVITSDVPAAPMGTIAEIFPDPGLAEAVANALGWNVDVSETVTQTDLDSITRLYAGSGNIQNIEGIQYLTSLTMLQLLYNQISDISLLAGLSNLTSLQLECNQISDISSLKGLRNLWLLNLTNNSINDISPLADLTNLQHLKLGDNQINDLDPLAGLSNLTNLELNGLQISDISMLAELSNLTHLYLECNQISDISSLSGLSNLTFLRLDHNQISNSNLNILTELGSLEILNLSHNQISDVRPLARLKGLKSLYLFNNQISDISPLAELDSSSLTSFYISDQNIILSPMDRANPLVIPNNIINKDGTLITPTFISDSGLYNEPDITWTQHVNAARNVNYYFRESVLFGSYKATFSGNVVQPLSTPEPADPRTVTVITRYLDNALPEDIQTYKVQNGSSFSEYFEVLRGYDLYSTSLRSLPFFDVDMDSKIVSLDIVERDYTIELVFDKKEYKVKVDLQYPDDPQKDNIQVYWPIHGSEFSQQIEIEDGYYIGKLDLPKGVTVDLDSNTVNISEVYEDYNIVLIMERLEYEVTITVVYEDKAFQDAVSRYTIPHSSYFQEGFEIERGYRIKNISFSGAGVTVNRAESTVTIDSVTSDIQVKVTVR